MRYRATFKENLGLYVIFGGVGLLMLFFALRSHQAALAAIGLLVLLF